MTDPEAVHTIDPATLQPVDPARVDIAYRAICDGMDSGLDIRDTAALVVRRLDNQPGGTDVR